ncbi:SAM-dependent methyltransferase [Candidatus Latescibacterota bacterium]
MNKQYRITKHCMFLFLYLVLGSVLVTAQSVGESFTPQSGQEGKDVVWVPTSHDMVDIMLDLAEVTPDDYLIDLGSGDGRTVIAAAKRGVRAYGIEYNPQMVELSKKRAEEAGVGGMATFAEQDLFEADFSDATVITMFLLTSINIKLRPTLFDLKPGTRIVSNTFTMEEWETDGDSSIEDSDTPWGNALLWIVPAKVAGTWKLPTGTLTLEQEFQMISGTLKTARTSIPVEDGRLRGTQIGFTAGESQYTGIVDGNSIEGTVTANGSTATWSAVFSGN